MEYTGISLAVKLFKEVIQLYNIYTDTREAGKKFVLQTVLLHIQKERYRNWGELVGLDKGNFSPPVQPTQTEIDMMVDVLAQTSEVLIAASNFESKYQKSVNTPRAPIGNTELTAVTLTNRQLQHRKLADDIKARSVEGLKLALWDKDKFERLIYDLTLLIDCLESLTKPYKKKLEAMLYSQMLQTEAKDRLLTLSNATHSTDGILSELATRKASYIEMHQRQLISKGVKKFDFRNDPLKLKKSDIDFGAVMKTSMRDFGTYQSRTPIIIEWKMASEQLSENEVLERISDIASFLSTSSITEDTHLPQCLGYYSEPGNTHRIALVFKATGGWHRTLAQAIKDQEFANISLGTRYRLGLALAESIFFLRLTGWLHKGIRSSNILLSGSHPDLSFLPANITPQISLLLAGFTTARLDGSLVTSEKVNSGPREELYHHPDYQRENKYDTRYNFAHDVYSLGICLLEIAMWQPIDELGRYDPRKYSATEFARKLAGKRAMDTLDFTVGKGYRRAVEWCLTRANTQEEVNEDDESKRDGEAMEFWDGVVQEPGNCCSVIE